MDLAAASFGAATIGAIVLATRANSISGVMFGWVMVSVWAAANLLWLSANMEYMALIDAPVAMMAFTTWWWQRCKWQAALVAVYSGRLALQLSYPGVGSPYEIVYFHVLNLTFVAALACISWEGGADVARDCLSRLRRLRVRMAPCRRNL